MLYWLAQTKPASTQPFFVQLLTNQMFPIILMLAVLWFFVIRGKRTQDKARKNMLSELKKGDRVQTIGGIIGTVIEARELDVLVKVDESSNTKIRFTRSAIHKVLDADKAETK